MSKPFTCDVVVVGAGMVGAACALYAARAGLDVAVVDRGPVTGGTTGAGEGNLLVSDKEPGPELDLALFSGRLWADLAQERAEEIEYEAKGGVVVAATPEGLAALETFAAGQRAAGVLAEPVTADRLHDLEPYLAPGLAGAVRYPQDTQVMPALAAAHLLRASGARLLTGRTVTEVLRARDGSVRGVRTDRGDLHAPAIVNAAGTWGAAVASLAGVTLPVLPRRGFVLVTEPLPRRVRHKVYAADYVADVASDSAALQTSPVVEGTAAGPILIGASRERVGFDRSFSLPVVRELAAGATRLFPFLAEVRALRTYLGFRPYLPDHLPAIGPDPRAPGLFHACGHEGAGIGLSTGTGQLIAQVLAGKTPELDLAPFRPDRFPEEAV
ncbi:MULTISPECIES: FAD-binding oxidoreductase [unclassified Streptomyces]|uniref:NAD(P)/FAD-dependent oxidoreductase n=1 Tax=unclassified Streptomyces TaxID=2593676 RepID=UPI002251A6F4|nr:MULTISPECIES: FAD-binding oxidoreductase [unclassified Streptomyces]MCX4987355.1 FAD-binding oxidoreductase [Streptomyces sp. NBC_00568]MCX5007512.1 FAD-binding oxidoreductase [Streptomyces sp. NBC_00638]